MPESTSEGNPFPGRWPTSTGQINGWLTTSAFGVVVKWDTQPGLVAGAWAVPLEESDLPTQLVAHITSIYPARSPFLSPALPR